MIFPYLDTGSQVQQMKSMLLTGSVAMADADPQFS